MSNYIDGFAFPILTIHLDNYKKVAEEVAKIWKEHGALAYFEYTGDDMHLEGTKSFSNLLSDDKGETIIFGWVLFDSKETRNLANERVAKDPRMENLIAPLSTPDKIFHAERMAFGGFKSFIELA